MSPSCPSRFPSIPWWARFIWDPHKELWPRTVGEPWEERSSERWWGSRSHTVVWREWKLLRICLGDPGVAHGCRHATGSYHAGRQVQPLPSHHQSSLLNLLLLMMHLSLSKMLVQDFPLSLGQHLGVNRCLEWGWAIHGGRRGDGHRSKKKLHVRSKITEGRGSRNIIWKIKREHLRVEQPAVENVSPEFYTHSEEWEPSQWLMWGKFGVTINKLETHCERTP